jgi:alpha-tubulin suppressor-like RCC1 family protein
MSKLYTQVFTAFDGTTFSSKEGVEEYVKEKAVRNALGELTNDSKLIEFIVSNSDEIKNAFETGTVRRVTKKEKAALSAALDAAGSIDNAALGFLKEHGLAILASFKWPTVKQLSDEEKIATQVNALNSLTDNEELTDWLIENKVKVIESLNAGVIKREITEQAKAGLARWRAEKAAAKAEAEAA